MRRLIFRYPLTVVAVFILASFVGGAFFGATRTGLLAAAAAYGSVAPQEAPVGIDFTPVWRAWSIIDSRYVPSQIASTTASSTPNGFKDPQQRVWGMIQGLAVSLGDPYTVFFPPAEAQIFEDDISGSFEGVGMEIAIRNSMLTVVSPLKDTPAYRAGILAGDVVTKINNTPTAGLDVSQAVKIIRGPKGSTVEFEIYREGENEARHIKVERDVIVIPTIKYELRKDGVYYIALYNFSAVSTQRFEEALREFVQSGSTRLVLDLRGNPGGYLQAAVDIASWFLPAGKLVVTEDYGTRGNPVEHRSLGRDVFNENLKMIVLVDKGSASASEILAAALRHYKKATLVGMPTFGKGSVQELVNITPETSLKITIARWLGPDGAQIPHIGIAPDIEVKPTEADTKAGKDVQLDRAVAELLKRP